MHTDRGRWLRGAARALLPRLLVLATLVAPVGRLAAADENQQKAASNEHVVDFSGLYFVDLTVNGRA